ncbi:MULTISPECIES: helix-turn-helix domain-containing protein [Fructobacillus]|uniref:Helix-turn-helix transcriptional regulator n=2 Tax=Fructobacillus TaxID=559173 RepID=A0ABS5QTA6_9LACO|nr:helix-turn-helix transcriptional regulator [Fructobacillus papyrifericola]MBS9336430.1 helix-turn-helix transcriptional regulator [Fructobacillus papyrifericola]CAK1243116.1 hypothetical protein R54839_PPFHFPJH_00986 [Fructobacillus fructosus]
MSLYSFIIKKLNEQNKSVNWLNREAGISSATIYRMRNKKDYTMNLATAIKIADALNFSMDEFRNTDGTTR